MGPRGGQTSDAPRTAFSSRPHWTGKARKRQVGNDAVLFPLCAQVCVCVLWCECVCCGVSSLGQGSVLERFDRWCRSAWAVTKAAWSRGEAMGGANLGLSPGPRPSLSSSFLVCKTEVLTWTSRDIVWDSALHCQWQFPPHLPC